MRVFSSDAAGLGRLARAYLPAVDLSDYRREYEGAGLDPADVAPSPFDQFARWFAEVERAGIAEPNAAVLATADVRGAPSVRHVLVKTADAGGFVFYTNARSRKAAELRENPRAALCFTWSPVARQVCVEGSVAPIAAAESDAYFARRPRESQLGAWASPQSAPVADRAALEAAFAAAAARFPDSVPRPGHWGGYRLRPERIEFWQGRPGRLHDRVRYEPIAEGWRIDRLAP